MSLDAFEPEKTPAKPKKTWAKLVKEREQQGWTAGKENEKIPEQPVGTKVALDDLAKELPKPTPKSTQYGRPEAEKIDAPLIKVLDVNESLTSPPIEGIVNEKAFDPRVKRSALFWTEMASTAGKMLGFKDKIKVNFPNADMDNLWTVVAAIAKCGNFDVQNNKYHQAVLQELQGFNQEEIFGSVGALQLIKAGERAFAKMQGKTFDPNKLNIALYWQKGFKPEKPTYQQKQSRGRETWTIEGVKDDKGKSTGETYYSVTNGNGNTLKEGVLVSKSSEATGKDAKAYDNTGLSTTPSGASAQDYLDAIKENE